MSRLRRRRTRYSLDKPTHNIFQPRDAEFFSSASLNQNHLTRSYCKYLAKTLHIIFTKKTGALCYTIKARILDVHRDRHGRVQALEKALYYNPDDISIRHQYGVALSRIGQAENAIKQFDIIINKEKEKAPPSESLIIALKTRMINNKRLGLFQDIKQDLEWLDELFKKYPSLALQATEFDEFRE